MNKNIEDFKTAALKKRPSKWIIHNCSICGYPCGYVFNEDYTQVGYDSGCNCVTYENITARPWSNLAEHYNMQTDPEVIKKMDQFWGFDE